MSCRRVRIANITIDPAPITTIETTLKTIPLTEIEITTKITEDGSTNTTKITNNTPPGPKPLKKVDPLKTVKEGISKKILRSLFSECDYFEVIKKENPMVYDSIKDKIKYFSPAFHSTTPEGLNARLTFLNQCMRPGQTIPVIDTDGRPKYNDALNTSFGAPPVLVLRIGDFYHTKIIPNRLGITYDPLLFDINPEGIGVQPMIAKITLSFDFIGGNGLAGPVEQLQNALSFNYYANTEIYDERAVATEDTSKRDNEIVGKLVPNSPSSPTVGDIPNNIPQKGGETIGKILGASSNDDGTIETGELDYSGLISELSTSTKDFFSTIYNKLKSINDISNYGILQLVNFKRKYFDGNISEFGSPAPLKIYGKPDDVEKLIKNLVDNAVNDCKNDLSPVIKDIVNDTEYTNAAQRQVKNKLEDILKNREGEINNFVIGSINELTSYQENLNYTFRKTDVVISKIDGILLETGKPKVYIFTGSSATTVSDSILNVYKTNVASGVTEFFDVMLNRYIIDSPLYSENINVMNFPDLSWWFRPFSTPEQIRFYMVMSDVMLDDNKYTSFIESLTSLEKIKSNPKLVSDLKNRFDDYRKQCKTEKENENRLFNDYEKSPEYEKFQNFEIPPFDVKVGYTTDKNDPSYSTYEKRISDLYSKQNLNTNDKYNGKIKFN
jgi:hypothetical protein